MRKPKLVSPLACQAMGGHILCNRKAANIEFFNGLNVPGSCDELNCSRCGSKFLEVNGELYEMINVNVTVDEARLLDLQSQNLTAN